MTALYNDIDPEICAWVEELVRRDLIAPGEVWCRDIQDIRPDKGTPLMTAQSRPVPLTRRASVSKAPHAVPVYPRPPATDGNSITREAKAMYLPAWRNLTRKEKACASI